MSGSTDLGLRRLLGTWSLEQSSRMEPLTEGTNNLSYLVESAGKRYVLRIYRDAHNIVNIQSEHMLLIALHNVGLSFAVPVPLPTKGGNTLGWTVEGRPAVLFHFLPGEHAHGMQSAGLRAVGSALGELDAALARLPASIPIPSAADDLPASADEIALALQLSRGLPLSLGERTRLAGLMEDALDRAPTLRQTLPTQIVHRDIDGSNVLVQGNRVTAVLDFEFARCDVRALDLAVAVLAFGPVHPGSAPAAGRISQLAAGYREWIALTDDEIEALPDLIVQFRTLSLIHRERMRQRGQATGADVLSRARGFLRLDTWLRESGGALVSSLR